jgi:hypothetical protein
VRVRADAVDLGVQLLEARVLVGQIAELRGAHEREVCRIEEENRPLPLEGLVGHGLERALVVNLGFELG